MTPNTTPHPPQRTWAITADTHCAPPALRCTTCGPLPHPPKPTTARETIHNHLRDHLHQSPLAPHLRTCQCRENGCRWHPPHRGCDGLIALYLTHHPTHHLWRVADLCHACATTTPNTAHIPDPPLPHPNDPPTTPTTDPDHHTTQDFNGYLW
ncbi:hypothetical protein [Streptomyces barkulensis]|uniref:hypothetical protein n=1 Tax=Streptomyces barkulensis TaxID=1257026 RepID=UPI00117FB6E4|nr:hypothetical protein [Streptomyces barkulensis]